MKTNRTTLILLLIVVLLMGLPAVAQTSDEVELIGTVEAMTVDTITVNSQAIDVTSAQINTQIGLGTIVEVEGILGSDGTITAREINAVPADFELGEAEFIGRLSSFDGSTLVINGQTIDTSNAQVQDGITFGGFVRVHAVADDTGRWTARAAAPFTPDDTDDRDDLGDDEFFLVGTLEEIGNGTITIAGQTIAIDETTDLDDMLMVGLRMKVRVGINNNGWVAREIDLADDDDILDDDDNDNGNTNSNSNTNRNDNDDDNDNSINASTAITEQQANDMVLAIYPNTRINRIRLTEKFGGTLVWEVLTSHGIEVNIDAQNGTILTIERDDDDDDDDNFNANTNTNVNTNFNANANTNSGGDSGRSTDRGRGSGGDSGNSGGNSGGGSGGGSN